MMIRKFSHISLFGTALCSCLLMVSCARDRDLRDYKNDELKKDLAALQAIEGVYAGTLTSNSDNSSLGAFGLELTADTKVTTLSEQTPVLRGTVMFSGNSLVKFVFQDSSFDSETSTFKSTFKSTASTGEELRLVGHVVGDKVTGTLEISGYPETGTHFETTKQVSLNSVEAGFASASAETNPVEMFDKKYVSGPATLASGKPDLFFKIEIANNEVKKEDRFIDLLSRAKRAKVSILYKRYASRDNPEAASQTFSSTDAVIDSTTRILTVHFALITGTGAGTQTQTALLECIPSSATDYSCKYTAPNILATFAMTPGVK